MVGSDNFYVKKDSGDFPGSPVVKNSPCDAGTHPGLGRFDVLLGN